MQKLNSYHHVIDAENGQGLRPTKLKISDTITIKSNEPMSTQFTLQYTEKKLANYFVCT